MKKLSLIFLALVFALNLTGQTCEERETKLLETMGGLSAGFLYNTYISIGAVSDGFVKKVYNDSMAYNIFSEQLKLIDNVSAMLRLLVAERKIAKEEDRTFVNECLDIMSGLRKEANSMIGYIQTKKADKLVEFDKYRTETWIKIASIMGIDQD